MLRALLDIAIKSRRINLILGAIDSTLVIKIQRKIAERCKQGIWLQIFCSTKELKRIRIFWMSRIKALVLKDLPQEFIEVVRLMP